MSKKMWNVETNPMLISLAEKAGLQPYYDGQEVQMKLFMDVVVKECSRFADPITKIHMFNHFGIEEQAVPGISNDVSILEDYIVLYREDDFCADVFAFKCQAEDLEHAEEQFMNAYPEIEYHNLVWVVHGSDVEAAIDYYHGSL